MELDDNLKKLMKELGAAINDALADSAEINAAIQNVKKAGYDIFLVLETTIGVHRVEGEDTENADQVPAAQTNTDVQFKVNAQDMKFLKSLKIKIDDPDN